MTLKYAGLKKLDQDINRRAHLIASRGLPVIDAEMIAMTTLYFETLSALAWAGFQVEASEQRQGK